MFNAFCTASVLRPALSEIFTKKVPTIENKIPTPAIIIGNRIGAISPNWFKNSRGITVSLPNTMVAKTVAT